MNNSYLVANFIPLFKDIVFTEGVEQNYKDSILNFIAEWESYSQVISISTSGSTGPPKTIEFSKKQAEASAKCTGRFFDFKTGDALLLNLSTDHVAGKLMIVRALVHNLKLVVAPLKSNPLIYFEKLPAKIKLAAFVPYQVEEILSNTQSQKIYNQIENVIIGGTTISYELEKKIAVQKNKSYATFGMTETLTHFALRPVDGESDLYTCLPGITIDLDERGCVIVNQNEILIAALYTNDIIEKITDTQFIWKGRFDNLINSGGVKIHPETDEKLIREITGSKRFYLTSKVNSKLGEEVILVLEGKPLDAKDEKDILSKATTILPKYHAPKSIVYLSEFEQTPNGKIRRKKF